MFEIWKDIPNYSGYQVSNTGLVRSFKNQTTPLLLKQTKKRGYLAVNLWVGKVKTIRVHRLVALLFVDNPYGLPEVNHEDGNKANNVYTNLTWTNRIGNVRHAVAGGRFSARKNKGEDNCKAKVTNEQAINIFESNLPISEIAKNFNVSYHTIWDIKSGRSWNTITNKPNTRAKTNHQQ